MQNGNPQIDTDPALLAVPDTTPGQPDNLRGRVWMSIQTRQAQRLFRGRPADAGKPAIIGLVGFANRLKVVWQGARDDDPYADWWLIKIHEGIEAAGDEVRSRQQQLIESLKQMKTLEIDVAASKRPYRVPLNFANPYAYQGAKLLAEFDLLVCYALTLRHVGLLSNQAGDSLVNAGARKLRSLFMIPQGYRLLKLNREQVRANVGRSSDARRMMGALPENVLDGTRKAPLVPTVRHRTSDLSGQIGLHSAPATDSDIRANSINDDI
jgi:integrating conjugative element protein (TIGR03761 family)